MSYSVKIFLFHVDIDVRHVFFYETHMCNVSPRFSPVGAVAVFIYSMPLNTCTIRERMLYSSCKNPLVDMVENQMQMEIEKKVSHTDQTGGSMSKVLTVDQLKSGRTLAFQLLSKHKTLGQALSCSSDGITTKVTEPLTATKVRP